jgi:uncharacterized protein YceK
VGKGFYALHGGNYTTILKFFSHLSDKTRSCYVFPIFKMLRGIAMFCLSLLLCVSMSGCVTLESLRISGSNFFVNLNNAIPAQSMSNQTSTTSGIPSGYTRSCLHYAF